MATTLLAFGLRAHRLAGQSIWYDEGLSVYYARQTLGELLTLVAASDHPPFYFLLLHAWLRLAGFGQPAAEFLVRFPSLLAGVLLVPLVYALGRRLLDPRAALIAALLTAVSPFQVWYAQEARMYTLTVLLTALASLLLVKGQWRTANREPAKPANLQSPRSNLRYPPLGVEHWLFYALVTTLALYTHFYTGFIFLAHAVFVTGWAWRTGRWRAWAGWAGAALVAGLLFLPWGSRAAGQLQANDTYWRGTLALGRTVAQMIRTLAVGETLSGSATVVIAAVYLCMGVVGLSHVLIQGSRPAAQTQAPARSRTSVRRLWPSERAMFLLLYILVPLVSLLAIAYNRPKFAPRYLLTVAPPLALLAGQGLMALIHLRWHRAGWVAATSMTTIILVGRALSLGHHYTDQDMFKPDWRAAARYIETHAEPHDAVVIVGGHTMPAFDFYNRLELDVYPIPPRLLPTVSQPVETADVTTTLNRLVAEGHDRTWLILWQEPLADPRRLTLEQLFDHGRRLGVDQGFHALGVLLFDLPPGTQFGPPQPRHPLQVRFDDTIQLYGYDLWPTTAKAYQTLTLRLYWRAMAPIDRDYTAFTQLLSPDDHIVAQHDRRLGGDLYPTSRWPVGEPVRETYELSISPDVAPGTYRLIAGVYLPATGERLPVTGNHGANDHVVITQVRISAAD